MDIQLSKYIFLYIEKMIQTKPDIAEMFTFYFNMLQSSSGVFLLKVNEEIKVFFIMNRISRYVFIKYGGRKTVNHFNIKVITFKNTIAWLFESYNNFLLHSSCVLEAVTHIYHQNKEYYCYL